MITLSERLQLELRNRDPREITELILDNSKANEIEGLDSSYINLRELSLVNVGLTTLKGFPSLPNLEKLDLSDNKISTGLENLTKCNKLSQLLLTNNRIKNIKDIECLANFSQLEILDLFNCTVSFEENYRKEIFAIVPTLKYLDGFDEKNEEELNESEEYEDEEEEIEMGNETNLKDVYELSDGTESDDDGDEEEDDGEDEEYETEEGEMMNSNRTSGKAPNTGGKDMNLYPNEVVEISDEEDEVEENIDEYDEDEDYDEKAVGEIIATNGKSKVNNNCLNESDEDDNDDDDDEEEEEEEEEDDDDDNNNIDDDNDIDDASLNGDPTSLVNGIDKTMTDDGILSNSLKRKYDNVFNDCYDEDECCDIKSLRNNSDFELTDESSLLDKV